MEKLFLVKWVIPELYIKGIEEVKKYIFNARFDTI
jgi:hypothetical protein